MKPSTILIIVGVAVIGLIVLLLFPPKKIEAKSKILTKKNVSSKNTNRNGTIIDNYDEYMMSLKEKIFYALAAAVFLFAIGFVFYRSVVLSLFLTPFSLMYLKIKRKQIIKDRKTTMLLQFKDALYVISSSLSAGKSIENAFSDALKDLKILYFQKEVLIIIELQYILAKLEMNQTVEEILGDFAKRTNIEDIKEFADIFGIAKRAGGNLIDAIKNSSKIITEKIEFKQELNNILAQKKFEQKLLNIIPVVMILVLSWTASDYMEPIFTTIVGRIVMTIALIIIFISYMISKKIIDIEV